MLNPFTQCNRLTLLLLGLLEDLLDDLLLLDQESTDDAVLDAAGASRSTVGALDGLLGAGNLGVLAGAEGWDTLELGTAVLRTVNSRPVHASRSNLHRTWGQCPSS
jgi:hypothetical protein